MSAALVIGRRLIGVNNSVTVELEPPSHDDAEPIVLLVVGVDKRTRQRWKYWALARDRTDGERADAILLVVIGPSNGRTHIVTIPRTLGVDLPIVGYQRLGWARDYGGASMLTAAVRDKLGIPIHHYVEFDFQGFAGVVDSLGGVDINLESDVMDWRAKVSIRSGEQRVGGASALGLVRSRSQQAPADGQARPVVLGDDGRSDRLAGMIEALADRISRGMRPANVVRAMLAARNHIVVDRGFTERDLTPILSAVRHNSLRFINLPVTPLIPVADLMSPFRPYQPSGSRYVEFKEPDAKAILDSVRAILSGGGG